MKTYTHGSPLNCVYVTLGKKFKYSHPSAKNLHLQRWCGDLTICLRSDEMQRLPLSYPGSVGKYLFHCLYLQGHHNSLSAQMEKQVPSSSALELLRTLSKAKGNTDWCSCVELAVEVIFGFQTCCWKQFLQLSQFISISWVLTSNSATRNSLTSS